MINKKIIQSPLNYIGGKFKLLPQILPLFPEKVDLFVDLFCGGGNVGINVFYGTVFFNDYNKSLIYLFNTFKNLDKKVTFEIINKIISKYKLSNSEDMGYEHYGCNSADGLGNYNREKFLKLRDDFNNNTPEDYYYYLMLYVLIIYSFNNQIRFNRKGEFNLPVGKRDFNSKMKTKLSEFIDRLQIFDCYFTSKDFREIDVQELPENSFVYADPPYLITCATYNEQNGWGMEQEKDLLCFLDKLTDRKIKFALSNVMVSNGKTNEILQKWTYENSKRYRVVDLANNYANSNYQKKDRSENTKEVLIINYEIGEQNGSQKNLF